MPGRIGVPPFGGQPVLRRRLTVLDPAYTGSGPPVAPTENPEPARATMVNAGGTDARGKTDWFKLLVPLLGLMAGGKKGLAYGTQFSVGMMGQEDKLQAEQASVRKESLAQAKQDEADRHAKEMERLAQAKIDAAEAATAAKEAAAEAIAAAKEKATIAEKNATLLKELNLKGDTEGVNWLVNADLNGPQGLLTPRSRVEQKPGQMTPRTRAEIARLKREPVQRAPATKPLKGPDGKWHTYAWDPETGKFSDDQGLAPVGGNAITELEGTGSPTSADDDTTRKSLAGGIVQTVRPDTTGVGSAAQRAFNEKKINPDTKLPFTSVEEAKTYLLKAAQSLDR